MNFSNPTYFHYVNLLSRFLVSNDALDISAHCSRYEREIIYNFILLLVLFRWKVCLGHVRRGKNSDIIANTAFVLILALEAGWLSVVVS